MGRTYRKMTKRDKDNIKRKKRQRQYGEDYGKPKKEDRKQQGKNYNDR